MLPNAATAHADLLWLLLVLMLLLVPIGTASTVARSGGVVYTDVAVGGTQRCKKEQKYNTRYLDTQQLAAPVGAGSIPPERGVHVLRCWCCWCCLLMVLVSSALLSAPALVQAQWLAC